MPSRSGRPFFGPDLVCILWSIKTCCTVCTVYCLYCVYCFPLWTPKISPIGLELIQFWLDLNFCGLDFFGPGSDLSAKLPTSKMTEFGLFIPRKWPECPILVDFLPIFAREWPNWPIFLSQISNYLVTSSIIRSSRSTGNDVSGH